MQDENNISISEKNEMECNVQWPTINLLAEFSKMSLTSSVQESKFVYICDEFIDKIKDKVESIQYFHSKLTKSQADQKSNDSPSTIKPRVTKNVRFVWTIYSTLLEGIVSEWETLLKKVMVLTASRSFDLYQKGKTKKKSFSKSVEDQLANSLKGLSALETISCGREKFETIAHNRIYGAQRVSLCRGEELSYVMLPSDIYNQNNLEEELFPSNLIPLVINSRELKKYDSFPSEFKREELEKAKEIGRTKNPVISVFEHFGAENLFQNVFDDAMRYRIEACLQLRHAKIHDGLEPDGGDRMRAGLFVAEVFQRAGEHLRDNFREYFTCNEKETVATACSRGRVKDDYTSVV